MPAWLFGLAITLLVGSASTAYLWLIRRRDDETSAGLLAIAGLRWREFTRILIEAMRGRGMEPVKIDSEDPQEPSSNFLLRNAEGRPWLLACKHGSAYRIGSVAMDELAAEIRLNGAVGGTLATEGTLEAEGRDKAAHHNIEILDGPRLWPVAKPFMDTGLVQRIVGQAKATALRHIGIAWLAAFTLGLAVMLALPEVATPPPDPAPLPLPPLIPI
ncbi:hypothetical protein CSC70_13315 [Pseudoxanthomonas kalamensis DSM 18571]|uniref:restriction endonuclease n=1 Tax=Pseudoxanthomonas kalamensis TaxID=289483 RepID=UPI00139120E6|nr:restriction endonuclease [Pseudoxanthomonas kalamensis]KAF1707931.1 hypothetical protein CSC70_13315 [Pseudoxanthomonas kalamensis DSM 18571]